MATQFEVEYLKNLIKGFVQYPDLVNVARTQDEHGVLLTIWVDQQDFGVVIGKGGTNFAAIRLVMKLVGFKQGERIALRDINFREPKNEK